MFESPSLKKFRIKKIQKDLEPNDIFLDKLAQKKEEELGVSPKKKEIKLSYNKFLFLFSLFFLFIIFLIINIFYFQIIKNDEFKALANKNKYITSELTAGRGIIYDSKGEQLVFNKVTFDLYLDFEKATKEELKILNNILKKEINLDNDKNLFKKNIDVETLILIKSYNLPSVFYEENFIREYKNPEIFSHILGYVGKISQEELSSLEGYFLRDYIGKMGLERFYDNFLKKRSGQTLIERDSRGRILSEEIISLPEPGYNLELWLEADLQIKLYEELKKVADQTGSGNAAAVAMNPKTGGILAMVSLPGFDNNVFSFNDSEKIEEIFQDTRSPIFNRTIGGTYVVGSTIKPLTGMAALEEKIISADKQLNCKGQISIPHQYNPEITYIFRDLRVHGLSDVQKAIAESCNVYFYTIGGGYDGQEGLGVKRIKEYLEYFGWAKKTGIDLLEEKEGLIPDPEWKMAMKNENWWTGDTYNLSIGQGDIGITPLQVVNSFSIIANGGTLFSPKIVKNILDQDRSLIKEIKPEIIAENLFLKENIEQIRRGMRRAVTGEGVPNASARILQSLPVSSAAKTGTAQTSRENLFHNWITVFAPYDDPEIVLTIIIEDVRGIQLTSSLVAKEVLEWYFKYDN